jgi:hypothetical protein
LLAEMAVQTNILRAIIGGVLFSSRSTRCGLVTRAPRSSDDLVGKATGDVDKAGSDVDVKAERRSM